MQLTMVVDEAALLRNVGGPVVMREQLAHLRTLSLQSNVSVGVIPLSVGAYPGVRSSFIVMRFVDPAQPDLLFIEDPLREIISIGATDAKRPNAANYLETFAGLQGIAEWDDRSRTRIDRVLTTFGES